MMKKWFALCLLLLVVSVSNGQIVINEVSTNNYSTYPDNDGDYEDWIELFNSGASAVNLNGYRITDNPLLPSKWIFPSVTIPANGYLTLFASGKDRVDFVDHYESLVLETNSWKYIVPSANITGWKDLSFNDAAWSSGNGGLGYADGDDGTTITGPFLTLYARRTFNVVNPAEIKSLMLYMDYDDGFVVYLNGQEIARANMSVTVPSFDTPADIDREAAMYSGGNPELFTIPSSTFSSLLVAGNNVLSIETHNKSATSSDLTMRPFLIAGVSSSTVNYQALPSWFVAPVTSSSFHTNFKLKAGGQVIQLYDASGTLINSVSSPSLQTDNTYGRYPNGSATLRILNPATPNASNGTSTAFTGYWVDPVSFSIPAGFYSGAQTLTLTKSNAASTIRYTTDGTKPTASSPVYSSPISITANMVVRAATFNTGYLPSSYETNSYFINQSVTLPVFSISTAPGNFFDTNTGIYVNGPTAITSTCPDDPHYCYNYWQDWTREIHVEYFDKGKVFQLEQDAGVKILGGWSRTMPMKSMQIRAGEEYGKKTFDYPFFDEPKKSGNVSFETITLRNGGNDFEGTLLRDAVNHRLLNSVSCIESNLDFEGYTPVVVFINGQYWGIHTLRERIDDTYFENNFGYNDDQIDYCEFNGDAKKGTNTEFLSMLSFIQNNDMTNAANYTAVKDMLDISNYIDYMIAELTHTNWDWPHNNIKFWQPTKVGGKWRYIYHDTDFAWGMFGFYGTSHNEITRVLTDNRSVHSPMLLKLLSNTEFKNQFINRYADLLNTIYTASNVKAKIDELKLEIDSEITRHTARWGGSVGGSYTAWNSNVSGLKTFVDGRLPNVRNQVQSYFSLSGQTSVTINALPAGAGRVVISTVAPCGLPWTGTYYRGVPVTVTAYANPGYTFNNWTVSGVTLGSSTSASNTVTFSGSTASLVANFSSTTNVPKLVITEINYQSDTVAANNSNSGDWFELYNAGTSSINLSGWVIKDSKIYNSYIIPSGTTLGVGQYLVFASDLVKFQSVNPSITNVKGDLGFNLGNDGETISIYDPIGNLRLQMTYNDAAPWPFLANGKGATLELINPNLNMNLASSWMDGCKKGSPGTSYSPCPCTKPSLGPDDILCLNGSSKTLYSGLSAHPNRSFTWYVNNIKVVGATSPNYTALVAGTITVVVDSLGCMQSDQILLNSDLTFSLGPDKQLCSPAEDTLRSYLPNTVTFAWYKNSTLLTDETKSFMRISSPGTYELRANGGSCAQRTDQVVVTSTAAGTPVDGSRCGAGTVALSITNTVAGKTYQWYDVPVGGSSLATGTSFTTPSLSQSKTYYVADASFYGGFVGAADTTFGNQSQWVDDKHTTNGADNYRFRFNVLKVCTLRYVTVYAAGPQNVKINLANSSGTQINTRTVPVTSGGVHRIPLDFPLTVGTGYYLDAVGTTGNLYYNHDNATYPFTEGGGYISITGTSPSWAGPTNGWYPYLYKWEFTNGPGPCDRIPVRANILCILPVDLVGLRVQKVGTHAKVSWESANEVGFSHYLIQRSEDGVLFETIGSVNAVGTNGAVRSYQFTDPKIVSGTTYYRLIMVDKDGSTKDSDVLVLSDNSWQVLSYPNPFSESLTLSVSGTTEDVTIEVTDMSGQRVDFKENINPSNTIQIGSNLPRGVYLVKIGNNIYQEVIKVQKQ